MKTESVLIPMVVLLLAVNVLPVIVVRMEKFAKKRKRKKQKKELEEKNSLENTITTLEIKISELENKIEILEKEKDYWEELSYDLEFAIDEKDSDIDDLLYQIYELELELED